MSASHTSLIYISASEYPSRFANSVQVVKQSNAFSHLGYSVTILGRANHKENFNSDMCELQQTYGTSPNVKFHLMNFRLISGAFRSALYPLWVAFNVFNKRPRILYGRHALGLLCAGLIANPNALIFECHGPPGRLESIALRFLIMLKKLDRIVVISKSLKNILKDRHPYLRRVETIVAHDGCETHTPSQAISFELTIGYVGSFYRGRGLDLIAKLATKLPFVQFHLIGGDENDS
jgi:glycosyltransferase involved in cell wall biosynthesis